MYAWLGVYMRGKYVSAYEIYKKSEKIENVRDITNKRGKIKREKSEARGASLHEAENRNYILFLISFGSTHHVDSDSRI